MAAVPQSNADRIRAMSDEKLAEFLASIQCPDEDMIVICNKEFFAEVEILEWLQSGAEGKKSQMAAVPKTNMDRIKNMTIGEMAAAIWCPYVKEGALPCMDEDLDSQGCLDCRREWIQREVEAVNENNL